MSLLERQPLSLCSHAANLLGGLLTPLRGAGRLIEAFDALGEAAGELRPIRADLAAMREQTASLNELLPVLERMSQHTAVVAELPPVLAGLPDQLEPLADLIATLGGLEDGLQTRLDGVREVVASIEQDESHLNHTVKQLVRELTAMHATVSELQDDVRRVTDHLPDPNTPGPLEKARAVLTGADS